MAKAHATRRSAHQSKHTAGTAATPSTTTRKHSGGRDRANRIETVSVKPNERTIFEDDEELNSGFGGYLHSGPGEHTEIGGIVLLAHNTSTGFPWPGHTMIKLFVLGNTLLILVTVAWPHIRDTIVVVRNLLLD